jgi:hypothetical protein
MHGETIVAPETPSPPARLTAAIRAHLVDGKVPCAAAFAIARQLSVEPLTVGRAANALEVRLTQCQLGLFGHPGKHGWQTLGTGEQAVPEGFDRAIEQARGDRGTLSCADAWRIAESFGVTRMQVGYLVDAMGVKIAPCQLGAF